MNSVEVAWAAGLFEGEGTVTRVATSGVSRHRYRAAIIMTDEDVLLRFHRVIGIGQSWGPYQPTNKKAKPIWRWSTTRNEELQMLFDLLSPWLGDRRTAKFKAALADQQANPTERFYPKLSVAENVEIRSTYAEGLLTQQMIGEVFGVDQTMVSVICRTTEGVLVETDLKYLYADSPLPIDVPRLNAGKPTK